MSYHTRSQSPVREQPLPQARVYIVDDDEAVRESLQWLLETDDHKVETFGSAEEFLNQFFPEQICVLILDVRMPGMNGLELQEKLLERRSDLPVIFITGHGDVAMAVSTMKKGAVDFLEKPFDETVVRELVKKHVQASEESFKARLKDAALQERFTRLTGRELQVLDRIVAGRLNKQIADDLNISIKTVEAHRANIMDKLNVNTVADLLKLALAR
ncbi:MAG: response regulator transcription factor [Burkholderiales bacterium]|jgi:FixJ family two-component response regulator|nr:response regulator transcription factor [Burkholderiales bacterium]